MPVISFVFMISAWYNYQFWQYNIAQERPSISYHIYNIIRTDLKTSFTIPYMKLSFFKFMTPHMLTYTCSCVWLISLICFMKWNCDTIFDIVFDMFVRMKSWIWICHIPWILLSKISYWICYHWTRTLVTVSGSCWSSVYTGWELGADLAQTQKMDLDKVFIYCTYLTSKTWSGLWWSWTVNTILENLVASHCSEGQFQTHWHWRSIWTWKTNWRNFQGGPFVVCASPFSW